MGFHKLWSCPVRGMDIARLSQGCMASGSQRLVDEMPGCWQVSRRAEPLCWSQPGAPNPPFCAAALVLPSPRHQVAHVGLGCWEPSGDAVVQDPKKPLILDLKTSTAGAVPAWEQVRGPANPSLPKLGLPWPGQASPSSFCISQLLGVPASPGLLFAPSG